MRYFTPIINFDSDKKFNWKKMLNIKIKYISDKEALKFFGISNRIFDDKGRLISIKQRGNLLLSNYSILNALQRIKFNNSRYAFVSDLEKENHIKEVNKICGGFNPQVQHGR